MYSKQYFEYIRDSIVVSIPACHAGDRGSIPRLGVFFLFLSKLIFFLKLEGIQGIFIKTI